MQIKFHGVGSALCKNMGNTHFLIESKENKLEIDCGGGLSLAQKIKRGEIYFENLFITHKHTDHFLGFFHLLRNIRSGHLEKLNVICSEDLEKTIRGIIEIIHITSGINAIKEEKLTFTNIKDKKEIKVQNFLLTPINLNSTKIEQHGFLLNYKNIKILYFGDEAINVLDRNDLKDFSGVDYLICEALCPSDMSKENDGRVDTKKICHITAKEAGKIGKKLQPKNLILVHTFEENVGNRQEIFKNEASFNYKGNIIVPNDGDILEINL